MQNRPLDPFPDALNPHPGKCEAVGQLGHAGCKALGGYKKWLLIFKLRGTHCLVCLTRKCISYLYVIKPLFLSTKSPFQSMIIRDSKMQN